MGDLRLWTSGAGGENGGGGGDGGQEGGKPLVTNGLQRRHSLRFKTLLIKGASTCRVPAGGKGEALCPMTPTLVQQNVCLV